MPIALRTWEGSKEPDVQAEPVETAIPSKSNIKRIDSPSISSKEMLTMLLTFWCGCPLTITYGIFSVTCLTK